MNVMTRRTSTLVRKVLVGVAGSAVLLAGLALIILPGPAILVIPVGLAILAREFPWAQTLLDWGKTTLRRIWRSIARIWRRPVDVDPVVSPR